MYEKMFSDYVKQLTYLSQNMRTLYSLVWGQCIDTMRHIIEVLKAYDKVHLELDGLNGKILWWKKLMSTMSWCDEKKFWHGQRRGEGLTQLRTTNFAMCVVKIR
jgi:hypothetical protein